MAAEAQRMLEDLEAGLDGADGVSMVETSGGEFMPLCTQVAEDKLRKAEKKGKVRSRKKSKFDYYVKL